MQEMKKLFTTCLLLGCLSVQGALLSPEQALERAQKSGLKGLSLTRGKSVKLAHTVKQQDSAALFVYNVGESDGYVILTADDSTLPVVGYSDRGSFDAAQLSPEFRYWLEEYANQIEYVRSKGITVSPVVTATRGAISPMTTTKWNQDNPYNAQCPVINGGVSMTGCVATSMAQVMKFWNYPAAGTGTLSLLLPGSRTPTKIQLASNPFDWGNMLNSYDGEYTNAQRDAVAFLMKCCGFSVKMQYSPEQSGAYPIDIGSALINYFKYNPNLSYESHHYYSPAEWEDMVYNEIASGRPVIYGGHSRSGGHSFVCDGYDGNGFYHFNWGWGGMSDGYFALNALDPNNIGIGGGTGGYNINQDILRNVQPEEGGATYVPRILQNGSIKATYSNGTIKFQVGDEKNPVGWENKSYKTLKGSFGVLFVSAKDGSERFVKTEDMTLSSRSGFVSFQEGGELNSALQFGVPSDLGDGEYKVYAAFNDEVYGTSKARVMRGESSYFIVSKNGGNVSVSNVSPNGLEIQSAEFTSSVYYNCPAEIKIVFKNTTEESLGMPLGVLAYKGTTPQFRGEGPTIVVGAGETKEITWITTFKALNGVTPPATMGDYTLALYDEEFGNVYPTEFKFSMNPEVSSGVSIGSPTIVDVEPERMAVGNWGEVNVYSLNSNEFDVTATIRNSVGVFASPIYLMVYKSTGGKNITSAKFTGLPLLKAGDSYDARTHVVVNGSDPSETYLIQMGYFGDEYKYIPGSNLFFRILSSGVNNATDGIEGLEYNKETGLLSAPGATMIEVYSLSGSRIARVEGDALQLDRTQGIVMVLARKSDGSYISRKMVL